MIGIIYKIKCNITNEIYIGSTTNFMKRKERHKELHYSSKNIIKRNNYNFYILDKREFPNNLSLLLLENLYIVICKKYCKCLNKNLAVLTKNLKIFRMKQYNHNSISKYNWYLKNKEKLNEKKRIDYYKNKDKYKKRNNKKVKCEFCNKEMLYCNLFRHKKTFHSNQ